MTYNFKPAQLQNFALSGSGAIAGATSITLQSFKDIDGNNLAMTDFGSIGYGTLEPGNGALEEQISFTGVSQNANGTATLSGVKSVLFLYPYTESSGLSKTHAGSTVFVISNTSGYYTKFTAKDDDATITGKYTFPAGGNANAPVSGASYSAPTDDLEYASKKYVDDTAVAGAPDANATTKGIVQLPTQAQVDAGTDTGSTGASLTPTPGQLRSRLLSDYVADTGAADAYVITPSPAITAYATGQIFSFKAANTNTGTSTVNVNAIGAKTIKKASGNNLAAGDIIAGQIVVIEYDGTNFQLVSDVSPDGASQIAIQNSSYVYAASSAGTDTYAITVSPTPSAYSSGQVFYFKADVANTGAATLNVNSLGAKSILRTDASALANGDIASGQVVEVAYDGTQFLMQSPLANSPKFAQGLDSSWSMSTASGSLVIAHGLGRTPRKVRLNAFIPTSSATGGGPTYQIGVYNGTNTASFAGTTNILSFTSAGASPHTQVATISVDATNITLAFTQGGSNGTETITIVWEAEA